MFISYIIYYIVLAMSKSYIIYYIVLAMSKSYIIYYKQINCVYKAERTGMYVLVFVPFTLFLF